MWPFHKLNAFLSVVALLVAAVSIGCGPTLVIESTRPAAVATPAQTPDARLNPDRLAAAVAFRTSYGLRSDLAWVKAVAVNSAAAEGQRLFGVPLMPDEAQSLLARARSADDVMTVVQDYALQHPASWGGAYVDTTTGHVVAMIVGNIAEQEAALRKLLAPDAPLELRPATRRLSELKDLQHRITTDGWLNQQGYDLLQVGARIRTNMVELVVSTSDPLAASAIVAHYKADGMLIVESDGTGVSTLPKGSISGIVVDTTGRPVQGLDVELVPDLPGASGVGDVGQETGQDGSFRFDEMPPIGYEIRVLLSTGADGRALEGPDRVVVGTDHAVVASDQVTSVLVRVKLPW